MPGSSIRQIAQDLAGKKMSSVELTQHFLDRIAQHEGVNCFIEVDPERALQQARAADKLRARGDGGVCCGLPIAHKDIFLTEGLRTTCGSRMLADFVPPFDATVVSRLSRAGVVTLGKTNMDEFAMGSSNENSHFGPVENPWDHARVPGGSSGGSAAAVAAGLAPAATGTDTGGSIRQPAAFCGLTGVKPTYGRVSRWGMVAFASSLDQAGIMAFSAEDCALLLALISGFDDKDSTSVERPQEDFSEGLNREIDGLRVGLPKQYFASDLDPAIRESVMQGVKQLEHHGATITEIDLPTTEQAVPAYYIVAPAECSSNLSRFDGVRYGYRCDSPLDLEDLYSRSRAEAFGAEVKRRIMIGTFALSAGYYDAYYRKAQQARRLIQQDFARAFESVDVIAGPTAPEVAFRAGEKTSDPVTMYLSDVFTIPASLAGLPALSLPTEPIDGLPVGLQLIGNYWQEGLLLNAAHRIQQGSEWHLRRAPDFFGD